MQGEPQRWIVALKGAIRVALIVVGLPLLVVGVLGLCVLVPLLLGDW